jgi:hypothetical protein
MKPDSRRSRLARLAAFAVVAALAVGGVATAAGTSVTLKLKGEYGKKHKTVCHKAESFRLYHRRSTVEFKGFLTPHPVKHFAVRLQLKRCSGGRWKDAGNRTTTGKKLTGKYKGFFHARPLAPRSHKRRAINYYFARTITGGARSRKVFFAVTN